MDNTLAKPYRPIRSFVRREGRLTPAQQQALEQYLPHYGVADTPQLLNLDELFGRRAPRTLEIGFGNGDNLHALALAEPLTDFIGIEVHRPGVGHVLRRLANDGLNNVRVLCDDAMVVLEQRLSPASLDNVLIFFPDPWPKKRHHKRRLVQPRLLHLLASRLVPGGLVHLCTDWEPYALQMLALFSADSRFVNQAAQDFVPRPPQRPITRFEARGTRLGHQTRDLRFSRL